MDPQDRFTTINIRGIDDYLAIKAPRPQQRAIQHIRPIGRCQHDDARINGKSVHLDQELIERLLALIIYRPDVNAPLTSDGIQFIDEYYTRRLRFGLLEQVTNASRAHTHKHFT